MTSSAELDLVAYGDESCKPVRNRRTGRVDSDKQVYVVAGMVSFTGDQDDIRGALVDIGDKLAQPLHYRRLSALRRQEALAAIAEIEGWEGYVFETAQAFNSRVNIHHVRAKLLRTAFPHLHRVAGVNRIVLETRNDPACGFDSHDANDNRELQRMIQRGAVPRIRLEHRDKGEPLLALADLLAGARTDQLCGVDAEPWVHVCHRIVDTVGVQL